MKRVSETTLTCRIVEKKPSKRSGDLLPRLKSWASSDI